jgi:hypothetical protein
MTRIKLLFTCPHGGTTDPLTTEPPTNLIERVEDNLDTGICKADEGQAFSDENDLLTEELTQIIYDNITKLSGKEPYKEIAKFHRKYIDYNRKKECAFELKPSNSSIETEQKYLEYHDAIKQKIEEMIPEGDTSLAFLFDIHGTGRKKSPSGHDIEAIIGTDKGHSIEALTERDPNAFWGPNGLIQLLYGKRIRVYPENATQKQQGFSLDGGYTVQEYGSKREPRRGLVAI